MLLHKNPVLLPFRQNIQGRELPLGLKVKKKNTFPCFGK